MSSIFDSILCWLVLIFRYIKWIIYKIIASGLWVYLPTICNIFSCLLGESGPSLPGSGPSLPGSDHYQGMPMEGPPGDLENLGGKSTSLQAIHDPAHGVAESSQAGSSRGFDAVQDAIAQNNAAALNNTPVPEVVAPNNPPVPEFVAPNNPPLDPSFDNVERVYSPITMPVDVNRLSPSQIEYAHAYLKLFNKYNQAQRSFKAASVARSPDISSLRRSKEILWAELRTRRGFASRYYNLHRAGDIHRFVNRVTGSRISRC